MHAPTVLRSLPLFLGLGLGSGLAASLRAEEVAPGAAAPEARLSLEEPTPIPHHHVGVFAGGATRFTSEEEEEEEAGTGMTVGLEYEYRFARHWGVGLLAEGIVTSHARDAVMVVPLNWHPWEWLKLSAAPGVEFVTGASNEFVARLGASYEIEFGSFNIAPEVSVDFTRNAQTLVYGLSVGRRF